VSFQPEAPGVPLSVRREDLYVLAGTLGLALLGLLLLTGVSIPRVVFGAILLAGAAVSFFRPEIGLHALVVNAIVGLAHLTSLPRIGPLSVPIAFEAVLTLAILFQALFRGRRLFLAAPQHLLLFALAGWMIVSVLANGRVGPDNVEYIRNGFFVKALLFLLMTNVLAGTDALKRLAAVLALANAGLLLVSLLVRQGYFGAEALSFSELMLRTSGLVHNPNTLAFDLITLMVLALAALLYVRHPLLKAALAVLAGLDLVAILSTLSRAGFVSLCAVLLFLLWKMKRNVKVLLLVAALGGVVVWLMPGGLAFRFGRVEEVADIDRVLFAKVGLNAFLANPVFGVGWGNYLADFHLYNDTTLKQPHRTHNMYLDLASQMGLPALVLYLAVLAVTWRRLEKMQRDLRARGWQGSFLHQFGWAVQACLVNLAVFGLSGDVEFWYSVFIVLGLGMLLYREHQRRAGADRGAARRRRRPEGARGAGETGGLTSPGPSPSR
jgi:O-antigen ligase